MITCTNGHQNPDSSRFCLNCGLMIIESTPNVTLSESPMGVGWVTQPETTLRTNSRPAWIIPVFVIVGVIVLTAAIAGIGNVLSSGSSSETGDSGSDNVNAPDDPIVRQTTFLDVTLTVFDEDGCNLGLGYDDVPGSTVTVSVDGVPIAFDQLPFFGEDGVFYCDFEVSIAGVPTDGSIYEIEIGRRGKAVLSRTELVADNWSYSGSLGL